MSKKSLKINTENISTENQPGEVETKKVSKKFNWKLFGNICFWFVISILGVFLVLNVADNLSGHSISTFGFRQSVIVSESMSFKNPGNDYLTDDMKQIQKYDVVLTKEYKSFDDVEKYDVVTYKLGSILVCHRVLDKYESSGEKYVVTRGDANVESDSPVNFNLVKGKVIKVTPKVGKSLLFFRSYYFLFALCGSVFFASLGLFLFDYSKDKKKKTDKEITQSNVLTPTEEVVEVKAIEKETNNETKE